MAKWRRGTKKLIVMLLTMMAVLTAVAAVTYAAPKISKKKVTLLKEQTLKLKVTGTSKKVRWSSSKPAVASVKAGKVTALKKGKATIVAKVGTKKLKCVVTVEAPKLSKTKATVEIGKTLTLRLKGTTQAVKWKSSNRKVATVTSKGVVKAVGAGSARVVATVLKKKFICAITVPEAEKESESEKESEKETEKSTEEEKTFNYARDCKVTTGKKRIYIEFKINTDTTSKEELEAAGYTVKDGVASDTVECETATYTFTRLPETLEDIKSMPLTTKFAPVAASICACAAFDTSKYAITYQYTHPIFDMMDYLNGPKLEISNVAKSGIFTSLRDTLKTGRMACFAGATPENGYTPTKPYTFTLIHGPYYIPAKSSTIAHPEGEPERHMILISFAGDDSQRYVDVYKSNDGNWYTWDNSWQHLAASMKTATSSDW